MASIVKVSDHSQNPSHNNLSLYFVRRGQNKDIGRWKWFQMLVVEAVFGEELLENIVICCAADSEHSLNRLVPRGILIDRARELLVEVLFFKHTVQYCMLEATNSGALCEEQGKADVTHVKFRLRTGVAYQIIYFRRVYHAIFLAANIGANLWLYFYHDNLMAAAASFAVVQLFKRAKL